jgi:hypothetical protein
MISKPDLFAALTLGVVVPLPAADAEVLKQRLNAMIVAVEAAEEKAATARRRVLAVRQLLDEEQAVVVVLERQAATKKLVPESTSFSTTETATASLSYIDTIVANLHIQADTMMEKIHLDTSGPAAASTVFYSNKTLSAPLLRLWRRLARLVRITAAAPATIMEATIAGIGTTTAAMAVVAARTATMVETAVATPPATPPWFPTAPPPTTDGVPRHGRCL